MVRDELTSQCDEAFGDFSPQVRYIQSLTTVHRDKSHATSADVQHYDMRVNTPFRSWHLPPTRSCSLVKDLAQHIRSLQLIAHTDDNMDLLQSLIVPAAYPSTPICIPSTEPQQPYFTAAPPSQISTEHSPPVSLTGEASHKVEQQESANTPKKKKKKAKKKQKQTSPQQQTVTTPVLTTPADVNKSKKRKQYHLFHPDRPSGRTNKRSLLSYEDLYDDTAEQQPPRPDPASGTSQSNPEATQTCFFWYHGSCRRSLDKRGCPLRHALQDPPSKVVAPPRFVHPGPCELEWCAGDGPTCGGEDAESAVEPKRYFKVAVSDVGSAQEVTDQDEGDESEYFLKGFEEPGA